jgi:hypothetical protein
VTDISVPIVTTAHVDGLVARAPWPAEETQRAVSEHCTCRVVDAGMSSGPDAEPPDIEQDMQPVCRDPYCVKHPDGRIMRATIAQLVQDVATMAGIAGLMADAAPPVVEPAERCGSWRVLHYIEGSEANVRWCERTDGPCPFPGSTRARHTADDENRRCATEPGTVLRVKWADECITEAYEEMVRFRDSGRGVRVAPSLQAVQIAVDALRTCDAGAPE